jgi:hypothetical protein
MEHYINRTKKYHQSKHGLLADGILADGIFSYKETKDAISGLIIFLLNSVKDKNYFPDIDITNLQKQNQYKEILLEIKEHHFKKILFKDKKLFFSIFLFLEMGNKKNKKREKI